MPKSFSLRNFEGPIDLLILLVQKDEVDIVEIAVHLLTKQLLDSFTEEKALDSKADQLALVSYLLARKGRALLPSSEELGKEDILESEERMALLSHILHHCQFRDLAKALEEKELESQAHFTRTAPLSLPIERGSGLEEVTLAQLKTLFEKVYREAAPEEESKLFGHKWEVSDKLVELRALFAEQKELYFATIFTKSSCKEELIVTFLALLELIKQEKVRAIIEDDELKFTTSS